MKLRALAKINLGLDVTGKREDGYHEVRMVMQTIQMYDQLEIKESKEPGIRLTTNLPFSFRVMTEISYTKRQRF